MKEIDVSEKTLYIRLLVWFLYPSIFVGLAYFIQHRSFIVLFISIAVSFILPLPLMLILNWTANLFSGPRRAATLEEQLAGELHKCRYLKSEKRFDEALQTANFILEQMPEHADALLLKAQLLSQSFADYKSARECLRQIIGLNLPADNTVRKWAKEMLTEVNMLLQEQRRKQIDEEKTKLRDATDALH